MEDPGKLMASPAETGGIGGGYVIDTYEPAYSDPAPTTGVGQFWWLADSIPFGRMLVITALGIGLLGLGFVAGRLMAPAVNSQVPRGTEPVIAGLIPSADAQSTERGDKAAAGFDLDRPLPELSSPTSIPRQQRLPWRDWDEGSAAYDLTNRSNVEVTLLNRDNMAEYSQRIIDSTTLQRAPSPEIYYVKRRTPAYDKLARFGDRPVDFMLPGTPLLIQQFDARWALVMPPGREAMWVRASGLTTERTHRYWY